MKNSVKRSEMKKSRAKRNQVYRNRIIVCCGMAVVLLLIILSIRSCGSEADEEQETVATETTELGTTEAEDTETEEHGTETLSTEIVEIETTATHDIPDVSNLEFPFTTMSLDWGEDTLEGWWHYDIPDEYEQTGGYLPDSVQVYSYALCTQYDIDYAMVLAIIEAESGYKYDAVSRSGAVGYMQIVPSLHSERLGNPLSDEAFVNPYLNINAGIDYLVELFERFGSREEVLTAYHYGVTGAYRDYWNKGEAGSPYSDEVLEIAERIQSQLDERAEEAQEHGE